MNSLGGNGKISGPEISIRSKGSFGENTKVREQERKEYGQNVSY